MNALQAATYKQPAPTTSPRSREVLPELTSFLLDNGLDFLTPSLQARHAAGLETYHVPLATYNGRHILAEQYTEALDGVNYAYLAFMQSPNGDTLDRLEMWLALAEDLYLAIEEADIEEGNE